jgi:hypothetical protein
VYQSNQSTTCTAWVDISEAGDDGREWVPCVTAADGDYCGRHAKDIDLARQFVIPPPAQRVWPGVPPGIRVVNEEVDAVSDRERLADERMGAFLDAHDAERSAGLN